MNRTLLIGFTLATAIAAGTVAWWRHAHAPAPAEAPPPAPAEPVAQGPSAPAGPASAPHYPIEAVASAPQALPPLATADLPGALEDLLGRKTVLSMLQLDEFPRRVAATVDGLGRAHAAPRLWPVNPMPGRFEVAPRDGASTIAPDNAQRYTAFVLLVETLDLAQATRLYVRMYPLLQQAYADLGYPNRDFNDRVVEVIDQLLATPEVPESAALTLTEVKGPIAPERPWVRYQWADPALERLSAGQKMLLRTGPVNARRLKARLAELRRHLAGEAAQR